MTFSWRTLLTGWNVPHVLFIMFLIGGGIFACDIKEYLLGLAFFGFAVVHIIAFHVSRGN